MASSLAVRKETDWKHMSVALLALSGAIDMHFTETSTFGYAAVEAAAAAASAWGHFNAQCVRLYDSQSDSLKLKKSFDLSVGVWCMDHCVWNMNLKVSMSLVTAQPHLGSKWHRTGLLTKCWEREKKKKQEERKKKDQIVCLCTHCIPGYLYRVKKLCRLHVSTWWELLNYWWMFLITSHKCWNTTLLQCLEEEEGGL